MSVSCDESASVWNEHTQRARKAHQCDACELQIRPGDLYTRDKMLFEGNWSTVVRCARCQLIFEHLNPMCNREGDCADRELDCGHEYRERWHRDPPDWLAKLAFWLPGDPLPATHGCTSIMNMLYWVPNCEQTRVCTSQVWWRDWYPTGQERTADCCAKTERDYSRSNFGRETPVKGEPRCTVMCS